MSNVYNHSKQKAAAKRKLQSIRDAVVNVSRWHTEDAAGTPVLVFDVCIDTTQGAPKLFSLELSAEQFVLALTGRGMCPCGLRLNFNTLEELRTLEKTP